VYRRFKALFIAICIDVNDSELAYLEFIQLFVEVLDHYFGEVKELDLIFNFNMVYAILDEMIIGGEIMETSKQKILGRDCLTKPQSSKWRRRVLSKLQKTHKFFVFTLTWKKAS
jgi:hypothetical protein